MAFLADVTSHLNDLNRILQGKNNSVCNLVPAAQSFQRKFEIFTVDVQEGCTHFPAVKQIQGETDTYSHGDFIQKLTGNICDRFHDFSLGEQLLLFHSKSLSGQKYDHIFLRG